MSTFELATDLTHVPPVDLRHHDKWDTFPIATQELLTAGQKAIDDLARAMERVHAPFEEPEKCGAKASGAICVLDLHDHWRPHEDWLGHTWFTGEAPR